MSFDTEMDFLKENFPPLPDEEGVDCLVGNLEGTGFQDWYGIVVLTNRRIFFSSAPGLFPNVPGLFSPGHSVAWDFEDFAFEGQLKEGSDSSYELLFSRGSQTIKFATSPEAEQFTNFRQNLTRIVELNRCIARAEEAAKRRDWASIVSSMEQVVNREGAGHRPSSLLGQAYLNLAQYSDAIEAFRQADERMADHPEWIYRFLGLSYLRAGEFSKAEEELRRVIENSEAHRLDFFHLGQALEEQGEIEEALGCFLEAIQIESSPDSLCSAANLEIKLARYDDAESHIRLLEGGKPENRRLPALKGKLFFAREKYADALPLLQRAWEKAGAAARKEILEPYFACLFRNKEFSLLYNISTDWLEHNDSLPVRKYLVKSMLALEKWKELIFLCDQTLADHDQFSSYQNGFFHCCKAKAQLGLKLYQDAMTTVDIAREGLNQVNRTSPVRTPEERDLHYHLDFVAGKACFQLGKLDRARELLSNASSMERKEKNTPYLQEIARIQLMIQNELGKSDSEVTAKAGVGKGQSFAGAKDSFGVVLKNLHDLVAKSRRLREFAPASQVLIDDYHKPAVLAVMGEFNAGKSTFINAYLGRNMLPTGILPTTATVNMLKFGDEPSCRVFWRDGSFEDIDVEVLQKYVAENQDGEKNVLLSEIRIVEIRLPVPALKDVWIVDTPGLNAVNPEHKEITLQFTREADATIWLLHSTQIGKASEKAFLEEAARSSAKIIGVVNHMDKIPDEDGREEILDYINDNGLPFESVHLISAKNYLDAVLAPQGKNMDQGFPRLKENLEVQIFPAARRLKRLSGEKKIFTLVSKIRSHHKAACLELSTLIGKIKELHKDLSRQAESLRSQGVIDLVQETHTDFHARLREIGRELQGSIARRGVHRADLDMLDRRILKSAEEELLHLKEVFSGQLNELQNNSLPKLYDTLNRIENVELKHEFDLYRGQMGHHFRSLLSEIHNFLLYIEGFLEGGGIAYPLIDALTENNEENNRVVEILRERFADFQDLLSPRILEAVNEYFQHFQDFCRFSEERCRKELNSQFQEIYSPIFKIEERLKRDNCNSQNSGPQE